MNGRNNIKYSRCLPDLKWINRETPILELAQQLDVPLRGTKTECTECGADRLTFRPSLNLWRCWNCDPTGKNKTPIDLVMRYKNCSVYEAAKWISERWPNVGRVQIERSENAHGLTKHEYQRYRQIPTPKGSKPSLQGLVASPGWREMPLSVRAVVITLLALTGSDENKSVTIGRRELGHLVGITDPNTIVKATREVETIGLFQVEKGTRTSGGYKPSSYRLTWFSARFQAWRMHGYDVAAPPPPLAASTTPPAPPPGGTSKSVGISNHPFRKMGGGDSARMAAVCSGDKVVS